MSKVNVKIKGTTPLLMSRFVQHVIGHDWRSVCFCDREQKAMEPFWDNETRQPFIPPSWIKTALQEASRNFRKGRNTYENTILSTVWFRPKKISMNKNFDGFDYRVREIPKRFIKPKRCIVICRPKFDTWELEFTLGYDGNSITPEKLKEILVEAGKNYGIGDRRPKFGRFEVVEFALLRRVKYLGMTKMAIGRTSDRK
jgi:hypothetical protein